MTVCEQASAEQIDADNVDLATPRWAFTTPEDMRYKLEMADYAASDTLEKISLSRDEYITLKHDLAARRGYLIEQLPVPTDDELWCVGLESTPPKIAEWLKTPEDLPEKAQSFGLIAMEETELDGYFLEKIETTREEYLKVKAFLAHLRGLSALGEQSVLTATAA